MWKTELKDWKRKNLNPKSYICPSLFLILLIVLDRKCMNCDVQSMLFHNLFILCFSVNRRHLESKNCILACMPKGIQFIKGNHSGDIPSPPSGLEMIVWEVQGTIQEAIFLWKLSPCAALIHSDGAYMGKPLGHSPTHFCPMMFPWRFMAFGSKIEFHGELSMCTFIWS